MFPFISFTMIFRAVFFFLATYGMLYLSYKHYTPDIGGAGDSIYYYQMFFRPIDFDAAQSPYIYRQISPIIASFIFKIGIFYDSSIAYSDLISEKKIFFSILLSNYLALFLTALTVSKIVDIEVGKTTIVTPLLAGLVCFVSFGASAYVMSMLVEGWTWFFIVWGFYAIKKQNIFLFGFIVLVSIFQKETISIVLGLMSFFLLICKNFIEDDTKDRKALLLMLLLSILSFGMYVVMRIFILPVDGYESQLDANSLFKNLLEYNYINFDWLFSNFLMQNIFFVFLCTFLLTYFSSKDSVDLKLSYLISSILSFFTMFLISVAAGLTGDIAHVLFIMSPIFSIYLGYYLYILEERFY